MATIYGESLKEIHKKMATKSLINIWAGEIRMQKTDSGIRLTVKHNFTSDRKKEKSYEEVIKFIHGKRGRKLIETYATSTYGTLKKINKDKEIKVYHWGRDYYYYISLI